MKRAAILLLSMSLAAAFSPTMITPIGGKGMTLRSARQARTSLRMADPIYEDDSDQAAAKTSVAKSSKKGGVSDSMRAKLLKENQALGGDPDAPAINFAVVIAGIIVSLLLIGNLIGAV